MKLSCMANLSIVQCGSSRHGGSRHGSFRLSSFSSLMHSHTEWWHRRVSDSQSAHIMSRAHMAKSIALKVIVINWVAVEISPAKFDHQMCRFCCLCVLPPTILQTAISNRSWCNQSTQTDIEHQSNANPTCLSWSTRKHPTAPTQQAVLDFPVKRTVTNDSCLSSVAVHVLYQLGNRLAGLSSTLSLWNF